MKKQISRVWIFASDSNPDVEYETLKFVDGATSCSCKGWCRRVAPDGSCSCKHTRYVDMGTADEHCKTTHNYETKSKEISHAKHQTFQLPKLGHRNSRSEMDSRIINYIRAGYSGLFLVSPEEQRVEVQMKSIAQEVGFKLYAWSTTTGLVDTEKGAARQGADAVIELPFNCDALADTVRRLLP